MASNDDDALAAANALPALHDLLGGLDIIDVALLARRGAAAVWSA